MAVYPQGAGGDLLKKSVKTNSMRKNNMKTMTALSVMAAAICAVSVQQLQADPLIPLGSEIDLQGIATLNGTLGTATKDTGNTLVYAVEPLTGPYSVIPNETLISTFNPFAFTGASLSPLWNFTLNGITYNFDLANDSIVVQNSAALVISGVGTLGITGYAPTSGTWDFSI